MESNGHRAECLPSGVIMKGEQKERWMELCEQAANEQDSQKLLELTKEIDRLLAEKEKRLKQDYSGSL